MRRCLAIGAVGLMVLAACGGDDEAGSGDGEADTGDAATQEYVDAVAAVISED